MKIAITIVALLILTSINAQTSYVVLYDFENSNHEDTTFSTDSTSCWQIGTPSKPYLNSAFSLPNAIVTDTLNSYPVMCNSSFTINAGPSCFSLDFKLKYQTSNCLDGLIIETWIHPDSIWLNLVQFPNDSWSWTTFMGQQVYSVTDTCTLYNGEKGISGTGVQDVSINFYYHTVHMSEWDRIIRFRFISDSIADGLDGFLIDDITFSHYICPSSVNELDHNVNLIYPNPVTDYINSEIISLSTAYTISDMSGKISLSGMNTTGKIDVSQLENGLYFLQLASQKGSRLFKFIKL